MVSLLDRCPESFCGRVITDADENGCEAANGQRWCISHLAVAYLRAVTEASDHAELRAIANIPDVEVAERALEVIDLALTQRRIASPRGRIPSPARGLSFAPAS